MENGNISVSVFIQSGPRSVEHFNQSIAICHFESFRARPWMPIRSCGEFRVVDSVSTGVAGFKMACDDYTRVKKLYVRLIRSINLRLDNFLLFVIIISGITGKKHCYTKKLEEWTMHKEILGCNKSLVTEGKKEMMELGQRYRTRFSSILSSTFDESIKVSSDIQLFIKIDLNVRPYLMLK